MKERIAELAHLAEVLYYETKGRDTITKFRADTLQSIIDKLQTELDEIMNELTRPEK